MAKTKDAERLTRTDVGPVPPAVTAPGAMVPAAPTPGGIQINRIQEFSEAAQYALIQIVKTGAANDIAEAFRENLGGASLSAFDFQRIRVPAGGGIAWELLNVASGEIETPKTFEGIIVAWNGQKSFWKTSLDDSAARRTPPDCYSLDTKKGIGNPGIECARCPNNVFGTAKNNTGRGKACRDVRMIFLMRAHDVMPSLLIAPPTSLKPVHQYFMDVASNALPYWSVVTRFALKRRDDGPKPYSQIEPSVVGSIPRDAMPAVRAYSRMLKDLLGVAAVQVRPEDLTGGQPDAPSADADASAPADGSDVVDSTATDRPPANDDRAADVV